MQIFKKIRTGARLLLIGLAILAVGAGTPVVAYAPKTQAAASTKVSYEKTVDSHTIDIYINSPLTDAGLWVKSVRLVVPDGWSKSSAKKYPALWLLHGGGDNNESWTKNTDIETLAVKHQVIVVMPDTSWCSGYSDWYDTTGPRWETYLTNDLRNLLDSKYAVDGSNAAVAGLSMGGLGSLKLAEQHPDMFKAVASFSGNADPLHAYSNSSDGVDYPGISCGANWKRVWGDDTIPAQHAIWERNDPYVQADKLAQMKYVYIASGDGLSDPLNGGSIASMMPDPVEKQVNVEAHALVGKLQGLNIPADSHFYTGTHSWPYWQEELHRSLPGLLNSIGVQ
ncbi:MAG TPA: alpha/beta hydrolase family protein [Patescibacteria group bacterium]|nr:alpha/beta hydrolase family protein [Patescibacteria group bacterium]